MSAQRTGRPPATWPEHIQLRYGVRGRRRWVPAAVAAVGVTFTLLVAGLGWQLATPGVQSGVVAYDTVADDRMDITFEVLRRSELQVTCVLRARSADGFDVGYAVVRIPATSGRARYTYRMRTAGRAIVGELLGCATPGPPPDVVGAQFRPGMLPPEQPWTEVAWDRGSGLPASPPDLP